MKWLIIILLVLCTTAYALYPQIYKSKAYNFNDPGVDAFAITLDSNNALYIWREIDGELFEVANLENFCEPVEQ
jgi:hypothetical protein